MATDISDERPRRQRMPAMLKAIAATLHETLAAIDRRCRKQRGRAALSELTDDELKDIGVSRSEAMTEAAKSAFWG